MKRRHPWSWIVLLIWSTWIYALLGRLTASGLLGGFTPDLGLVLLLALAPGLSAADARLAALFVGLARAAFSADAPLAIVAGLLAAVELSRALGGFVEADGAVARSLIAGAMALFLGVLLALVHAARLDPTLVRGSLPFPAGAVLRSAVATALAASVGAPLLARLPGVSPFAGVKRRRAFA
jgi:hypothetical protein